MFFGLVFEQVREAVEFEPRTVLGVQTSTVVGVAMTGFVAWRAVVNTVYRAWWETAGFLAMTAMFGVQFLTGDAISNPAVIFSVVGVAMLLLLVGNARDDPSEPPRLTGP